MKKVIIFLSVLLLLTSCKQGEGIKRLDEPSMDAAQSDMENSGEENSGTEENPKNSQTFHADPKDFYEELFYEELDKNIPHKEETVNLIVPITTDTISNGTVTRYLSNAYWGQFSLEDRWLKQGKCAISTYELIVLQGKDGSYQVVLSYLDPPKLEITENGEIIKYDGLEEQLKKKIADSLSQEDQKIVLEYLALNTDFPQTFLKKFLPRTKEKIATEIQPKIQTVIEQYLKSENLTIDGYTSLSEKRFRAEKMN